MEKTNIDKRKKMRKVRCNSNDTCISAKNLTNMIINNVYIDAYNTALNDLFSKIAGHANYRGDTILTMIELMKYDDEE